MFRSAAVIVLVASCLNLPAATKPRLPERYKNWLTQEVVYIIPEEERKQFLALTADEDRDRFIENFWEIRNPLRGSKRNPYKEEHYKRLEYANSHFGRQSNTPGWMTDMGQAYIELGKPVSRHPFTGYGQLYPLEIWFYSNETGSPSLPPFFYLMFYIPEDIGEFKFYRPSFDGPMKLVRGSQFHTNSDVYKFLKPIGGDIAHAALSLIPNDPIDTTDYVPDMSSDMLVNRIVNFANDSFITKRLREARSQRARVSSYFLLAQDKPLEIESIVLSDPLSQYWLDYSVSIDDRTLGEVDAKTGKLGLSVGYRLYTAAGELIVEDSEDSSYDAFDQAAGGKFQPFQIANRLPVLPGNYKLEVEIVNRQSGRTYKGERKFTVGPAPRVTFAGPLLASSVERVQRPSATTPFQYFGIQFHPSTGGRFIRREPVRLLFELQQPANVLPPQYEVEYVIAHLHDRESRIALTDTVAPSKFENGRLMMSKSIPLSNLQSGDYRLVINLRAAGSKEVLVSSNLPVKIEDEQNDAPLYFLANARKIDGRGMSSYIRALEAVAQKDGPRAMDYMRQALEQNPSNASAGQYLVQLYFNQRKFAPVTEIYKRLGISPFEGSPETLAQISLSFWQTGDRAQARDVLQAAQLHFPHNPLLAATASNFR